MCPAQVPSLSYAPLDRAREYAVSIKARNSAFVKAFVMCIADGFLWGSFLGHVMLLCSLDVQLSGACLIPLFLA